MDGFQARCLRKILKIPPAHISFVSNKAVRHAAGARPLSASLLQQQLNLFGKAALSSDDLLRRAVFEPGSLAPRCPLGPRAVGRPRATWATYLKVEASKMAGGEIQLAALLGPGGDAAGKFKEWQRMVREYCSSAFV